MEDDTKSLVQAKTLKIPELRFQDLNARTLFMSSREENKIIFPEK